MLPITLVALRAWDLMPNPKNAPSPGTYADQSIMSDHVTLPQPKIQLPVDLIKLAHTKPVALVRDLPVYFDQLHLIILPPAV